MFSKGAYDEVSVAQILEMSGLKAPSLYHHFGDKEGLYVSWVGLALEELKARVEPVADGEGNLHEKLRGIAVELLDGLTVDVLQVKRDLRLMKNPDSIARVRRWMEEALYVPVKRVLQQGIDRGEMKKVDTFRLSQVFVHQAMLLHPTYVFDGATDESYDWVVDLFIEGTTSGRTRTA